MAPRDWVQVLQEGEAGNWVTLQGWLQCLIPLERVTRQPGVLAQGSVDGRTAGPCVCLLEPGSCRTGRRGSFLTQPWYPCGGAGVAALGVTARTGSGVSRAAWNSLPVSGWRVELGVPAFIPDRRLWLVWDIFGRFP